MILNVVWFEIVARPAKGIRNECVQHLLFPYDTGPAQKCRANVPGYSAGYLAHLQVLVVPYSEINSRKFSYKQLHLQGRVVHVLLLCILRLVFLGAQRHDNTGK